MTKSLSLTAAYIIIAGLCITCRPATDQVRTSYESQATADTVGELFEKITEVSKCGDQSRAGKWARPSWLYVGLDLDRGGTIDPGTNPDWVSYMK